MSVGIFHYIFIGALLFYISLLGMVINRKSLIHILVCLELLLLAVNINFVAFSVTFSDIKGQIFTVFILTVAAAEIAIGLAIIVVYFRNRGAIILDDEANVKSISKNKGSPHEHS